MKILIGILGCVNDQWAHDSIRATWMPKEFDREKYAPHTVDAKFFVGSEYAPVLSDVVRFEKDDRYQTPKVREMFKWALKHGYDFVFKSDADTYVCVSRLLKSGFENHSWSGGFGSAETGPYGGSGYWLNRDLMSELIVHGTDDNIVRPWDEDRWVGGNLIQLGYRPYLDWRYHSRTNKGPEVDNEIITVHWYAEEQSYSGSVAPPPRIVNTVERLNLIKTYHEKAKEIQWLHRS